MVQKQAYTRIGNWWNRKGDVDIDLITADEFSNSAAFYEIKRNHEEYSPALLNDRKEEFLRATHQFGGYDISIGCLSMEDM